MVKRLFAIVFLFVACEEELKPELDFSSYQMLKITDTVIEVVTGELASAPVIVQVVNEKGEPQSNVPVGWQMYKTSGDPYASVSVFTQDDMNAYLLADVVTDKDGYARCFVRAPWLSEGSSAMYLAARLTQISEDIIDAETIVFDITVRDESHSFKAQKTGGDEQTGKINLKSTLPIEFKIEDRDGFAVFNYEFTVQSNSPGYDLIANEPDYSEALTGNAETGFTGKTDGNGKASFYWVYGTQPGNQTLTINIKNSSGGHIQGSPMVFTANVEDLELFISYEAGTSQVVAAGTGLPIPLAIKLIDENSELVPGYEVIWEVPQGHTIQRPYFWDDLVKVIDNTHFSSRSTDDGIALARLITSETTGNYSAYAHVFDGFGTEVSGSPISFTYSTYAKGSFTDPRDNKVYETIDFNGTTWFTQNLNYQGGNGVCYDDVSAYCDEFGTLYTWNEAINATPPGWHLPSDQEWKDLELYLGMDPNYVNDYGSARTRVFDLGMLDGEWSGFNILGGGYYSPADGFAAGKYGPFSDYGYADGHWTSDEYNAEKAIWRVLGTGFYSTVGRYADNKDFRAYVRCVKD